MVLKKLTDSRTLIGNRKHDQCYLNPKYGLRSESDRMNFFGLRRKHHFGEKSDSDKRSLFKFRWQFGVFFLLGRENDYSSYKTSKLIILIDRNKNWYIILYKYNLLIIIHKICRRGRGPVNWQYLLKC